MTQTFVKQITYTHIFPLHQMTCLYRTEQRTSLHTTRSTNMPRDLVVMETTESLWIFISSYLNRPYLSIKGAALSYQPCTLKEI